MLRTSSSFKRSIDKITQSKCFEKKIQGIVIFMTSSFQHHVTRRLLSRGVNNENHHDDDVDQSTEKYLFSLGYKDPKIQKGMIHALKAAFGNNISVSNLKSLGKEGLSALSKSVIDQLNINSGNTFVGTVHVQVPHHNFSFDLDMKEGDNFMDVALEGEGRELLGEYLECACGGNMSCATCHIILDTESYAKLDPPCEAECDMLDLAFEPRSTSRLGCQVKMTKNLDGMTVTIPSGVNNFWS